MKFYIFRHAETYETKEGLHYGSRIEISSILSEGIPATKRMAKYLKGKITDNNFTSPYLRCLQTARIVEKIVKKKFAIDSRLGEYRNDQESFFELAKRIENFLEELKNQKVQTVTICTHGGVMAGLKHFIFEDQFKEADLHDFPKPGILLEIKDGKIDCLDFN